jgi:hypothetical protein
MKGAVHDLVSCFERNLDLAGIGIDDKGLMLSERGWREYDNEYEGC